VVGALMAGPYGVIYADPPWAFATYSAKGKGRSAGAHYDCMDPYSIGHLLPILEKDHAYRIADNAVLLLWVTDPMLPAGLDVIRAWGFTYKTVGFYWAKCGQDVHGYSDHEVWPIGTGYWTRANPEQCLLATRGHPKRLNADVRKLIVAPRREHSRKPDEVYGRMERLCEGDGRCHGSRRARLPATRCRVESMPITHDHPRRRPDLPVRAFLPNRMHSDQRTVTAHRSV
jgi:N6-adenosine-specific RNA methylase IME4